MSQSPRMEIDPALKDPAWRRAMRRTCFGLYRYADNLGRMPIKAVCWRVYNRLLCPKARKITMRLRPRRMPSARLLRRCLGDESLPDLARAWLAGEGDGPSPADVAKAARRFDPEGVERTLMAAEDFLAGRFRLLENKPTANYALPFDWQQDPVHDHEWPHALNRFRRYARCLSRAYVYTGDERYAAFLLDVMDDWVDRNIEGTPIAWASMAICLRLIEWLQALALLRGSESLTPQRMAKLWGSMMLQAAFLARHPECDVPDNHLIYNLAGLLLLAGTFPFLVPDDTADWAKREFIRQLRLQHRPDGMNIEQSTHYFVQVARAYCQVHWMWVRQGRQDEELARYVRSFLDILAAMIRPDGTIPLYSDAFTSFFEDSGTADAVTLLGWGAVAMERGDLKHLAGKLSEDACWLLADRAQQFDSLPASAPAGNGIVLPDSGYAFYRTDWTDQASSCSVDVGPFGFTIVPGHAHPDLLSFEWYHRGRPVVIDPGTYEYQPGDWAYYFRRTRAHATVTVDQADQSTQWGFTRWIDLPARCVIALGQDEGALWFEAEHNGYARLVRPVWHRRRFVYLAPDVILVDDKLLGQGEHLYEQTFPLAPRLMCQVGPGGEALDVTGPDDLAVRLRPLLAPESVELAAPKGEEGPLIWGYSAANYGLREPAHVAVVRVRAAAPARIVSVLAAGAADVTSEGPGVHRFSTEGGYEYKVDLGGGALVVRESRAGLPTRAIAAGTASVILDGQTLECPQPWARLEFADGTWRRKEHE